MELQTKQLTQIKMSPDMGKMQETLDSLAEMVKAQTGHQMRTNLEQQMSVSSTKNGSTKSNSKVEIELNGSPFETLRGGSPNSEHSDDLSAEDTIQTPFLENRKQSRNGK